MNACIDEWVDRGFKNTMAKAKVDSFTELPPWIGNSLLHDTHKSNLLRKDVNFYVQYNWSVPMDLQYYWCGFSKLDEANYEGERTYNE